MACRGPFQSKLFCDSSTAVWAHSQNQGWLYNWWWSLCCWSCSWAEVCLQVLPSFLLMSVGPLEIQFLRLCSLNALAHGSPDMPLHPCIPHLVLCLPPWMWLDGYLSAVLALKKNPCSQPERLRAAMVLGERLRNLQMWKPKATW